MSSYRLGGMRRHKSHWRLRSFQSLPSYILQYSKIIQLVFVVGRVDATLCIGVRLLDLCVVVFLFFWIYVSKCLKYFEVQVSLFTAACQISRLLWLFNRSIISVLIFFFLTNFNEFNCPQNFNSSNSDYFQKQ